MQSRLGNSKEISDRHFIWQTDEMLNRAFEDGLGIKKGILGVIEEEQNKNFPAIPTKTPVPLGINLNDVGHPRINL